MAKKRPTYPLLNPAPGPWSLNWSLADHGGPFPWPDRSSAEFHHLAGFLAALNELSLDEAFRMERPHGGSAIHALSEWDLSDEALQRWGELYQERSLDEGPYGDLEVVVMTYCLEQIDGRRVVVAFDGGARTVYPLWWDTCHRVSGDDGRIQDPQPCHSGNCFHLAGL